MRDHYATFREMNAEVIALAAVDRKPLAGFARELKLPFPVLSDVTAEVYRAFGLGKGMVIRSRTLLVAARLVWRAKRLYRPVGDVMQIGGDFILDGAGLVHFAHSSEDPTDRPDVIELMRLIASLK